MKEYPVPRPSGLPEGRPPTQLGLFHAEHARCVCGKERAGGPTPALGDRAFGGGFGGGFGGRQVDAVGASSCPQPLSCCGSGSRTRKLQERASLLESVAQESEEDKKRLLGAKGSLKILA